MVALPLAQAVLSMGPTGLMLQNEVSLEAVLLLLSSMSRRLWTVVARNPGGLVLEGLCWQNLEIGGDIVIKSDVLLGGVGGPRVVTE
jgi:hypothetical protein